MFSFGTTALDQFVDNLIKWLRYCNHILQISHLRAAHSNLVAFIERTLSRISVAYGERDIGHATSADHHHGFIQSSSLNMEVGYPSPSQSAIREDLNISLSQFSMFGPIITIGAMIGAVASGKPADFIGTKGAMRISAVFCITGWLAIYFAMEAIFIDVGRFCTGYGMGILSYVAEVGRQEDLNQHCLDFVARML